MKNRERARNGFSFIELLLVVVICGLVSLIGFYLCKKYIDNSRKDSMIDSAYSFLDMVRSSLTAEDELPDLDKALLVPYKYYRDEFKKGGTSPFDKQYYDMSSSYVAIINRNDNYQFYVTLKDQSDHCVVLVQQEDILKGTRQARNYVRSGDDCKITPIDESQEVISSLLYRGEESFLYYDFKIYEKEGYKDE